MAGGEFTNIERITACPGRRNAHFIALQVDDGPVVFPLLYVAEVAVHRLVPWKAASEQDCQERAITFDFQQLRLDVFQSRSNCSGINTAEKVRVHVLALAAKMLNLPVEGPRHDGRADLHQLPSRTPIFLTPLRVVCRPPNLGLADRSRKPDKPGGAPRLPEDRSCRAPDAAIPGACDTGGRRSC
jgi:hypothetical protein